MQETFGPYRILRRIGAGGMGAVYVAEHGLIGRKAAIKVLHDDRASNRTAVDRFFNEARATGAVSDPGIVQIFDFGITPDNTAYIVMELLDGESLQDRLHRLGALAIPDALRIVRQAAGSLAAAHAAGIVHRDLKPDNLFMVRDAEAAGGERPKILDFGIAKLNDENPNAMRTRTGAVMGTPVYMSPEQCNDSGQVDLRTDIYSLGCVLHHLLTGRPPFTHSGVGALISAHLKESPEPPSVRVGTIPLVVDQIVARCLAKSPLDRFSSMTELQQACDAAIASGPAKWPSAPSIPMPPARALNSVDVATTTLGNSVGQSTSSPVRARTGIWIGLATVVIAVGIGAVVAMTRDGGGDTEPARAAAEPATTQPRPASEPRPADPPPVVHPAPPPPITEPAKADVKPDDDVKPVDPVTVPAPAKPTAVPTKPIKTKPTTKVTPKGRPTKPDDLYDDR